MQLLFHLSFWTDGPEVCYAPLVFSICLMEVTGEPFSSFLGTKSMSVINYRLCNHEESQTKTQVQLSCFGLQISNQNFFLQCLFPVCVGERGGEPQYLTLLFTNQGDLLKICMLLKEMLITFSAEYLVKHPVVRSLSI